MVGFGNHVFGLLIKRVIKEKILNSVSLFKKLGKQLLNEKFDFLPQKTNFSFKTHFIISHKKFWEPKNPAFVQNVQK